jgi:hypothetical protein
MAQPGGAEGAGLPPVEAITPLDLRLQQFAAHAGKALTDGEVAMASWFYQVGGADTIASITTASAAQAEAAAAENAATAAILTAEPGAAAAPQAAAPVEEQPAASAAQAPETKKGKGEQLDDLFGKYPTVVSFSRQGQPEPHLFANETGGAVYDQSNEAGIVVGGVNSQTLQVQANSESPRFGTPRPHEVVAFTETNNFHAAHMPEGTPDEPQVGVTYHASADMGHDVQTLTMRTIVPQSLARKIDVTLSKGEPRMSRIVLENAISAEMDTYGDPGSLIGEQAAEYAELERALGMVGKLAEKFDNQNGHEAVVTLSNVEGLGAGAEKGKTEADGFRRRVAPIHYRR